MANRFQRCVRFGRPGIRTIDSRTRHTCVNLRPSRR